MKLARLIVIAALIAPATATAILPPAVSLSEGKATAKAAFAEVQKKTAGATSSGVKTCWHFQKRSYLVDCKGYVKLPSRVCRLRVRVQHTQDGLVPRFVGPSTCAKRSSSLQDGSGTIY